MGTCQSPLANNHVLAVMDRALESPNGVKITLATPGEATHFRQLCYSARKNVRRTNAKVFPPDHPSHGACAYDELTIAIKDCVVTITRASIEHLQVEEL